MPSVSKSQQRLMGMAYAVKSGDMEISDIDPAYRDKVKSLTDGMTKKDLKKYASTKHDDLPETVDEGSFEVGAARITPSANIGGMGPVVLPSDGGVGSGDVPSVADIDDDEEEAKKDKTKKKLEMENFKLFTQFNNFVTEALSEASSNFKVLLRTAKDESIGRKIRLGDKKDPGHEIWEKIDKMHWMNLETEEKLDLNKWAKHADKFNMEGKDLQFENLKEAAKVYEEAVLENAVRDLHFETDPKKAEEMKIAIGRSQGEVVTRTQIKGGEYSLRRFRKEIKYDETGEDVGVFKPGSYMAATSKLGDGPHKKAVKKIRWNQKMYNQWIEDVASNGGWEHAFDMAQNAKHEPGLLQWAKKEFRGEDPMQRIQWDIEAYAESVVTEAKGLPSHARNLSRKLKTHWLPDTDNKDIYFLADTNKGQTITIDLSVRTGEYKVIDKKDNVIYQGGDPYAAAKLIESVVTNENRELMKIDSYLNTKDEDVLVTFLDDYFYNSADKKARKEWDAARDGLEYSDLVDYAVRHADNHGMDLQDMEDAIEVYETKKVKDHFSEWTTLNEKKEDRDGMMKFIKKHMSFVGTSEDFNGSEGGIHVSGEDYDDEFKGKQIYDYYSEDYKNREFGVLNSWEKELNKRGWYSEWYDAGTVMIWPQ